MTTKNNFDSNSVLEFLKTGEKTLDFKVQTLLSKWINNCALHWEFSADSLYEEIFKDANFHNEVLPVIKKYKEDYEFVKMVFRLPIEKTFFQSFIGLTGDHLLIHPETADFIINNVAHCVDRFDIVKNAKTLTGSRYGEFFESLLLQYDYELKYREDEYFIKRRLFDLAKFVINRTETIPEFSCGIIAKLENPLLKAMAINLIEYFPSAYHEEAREERKKLLEVVVNDRHDCNKQLENLLLAALLVKYNYKGHMNTIPQYVGRIMEICLLASEDKEKKKIAEIGMVYHLKGMLGGPTRLSYSSAWADYFLNCFDYNLLSPEAKKDIYNYFLFNSTFEEDEAYRLIKRFNFSPFEMDKGNFSYILNEIIAFNKNATENNNSEDSANEPDTKIKLFHPFTNEFAGTIDTVLSIVKKTKDRSTIEPRYKTILEVVNYIGWKDINDYVLNLIEVK